LGKGKEVLSLQEQKSPLERERISCSLRGKRIKYISEGGVQDLVNKEREGEFRPRCTD